jgi:hypothetical protein
MPSEKMLMLLNTIKFHRQKRGFDVWVSAYEQRKSVLLGDVMAEGCQ